MDESIYEGQTLIEYKNELKANNDPTEVLIEIAERVDSTIGQNSLLARIIETPTFFFACCPCGELPALPYFFTSLFNTYVQITI
jgi:hypothetical protein